MLFIFNIFIFIYLEIQTTIIKNKIKINIATFKNEDLNENFFFTKINNRQIDLETSGINGLIEKMIEESKKLRNVHANLKHKLVVQVIEKISGKARRVLGQKITFIDVPRIKQELKEIFEKELKYKIVNLFVNRKDNFNVSQISEKLKFIVEEMKNNEAQETLKEIYEILTDLHNLGIN